jgi:8-amino-7-oxononanoate synthase
MNIEQTLQPALDQRRAEQLYRRRRVVETAQGADVVVDGKRYLNFCSNDYLGLANHPAVVEAFQKAAAEFGVGSGASHLVCGHSRLHHELEEKLAAFTGRPRALLFSTGYMANLGVINALLGSGDHIFQDRLNHASLLDGGLLSGARFQRFLHNDCANLEARLRKLDDSDARKLICVDSVFSMDGDTAPLPALAALARRHGAWLMADDAHGFGVLGERGAGCAEQLDTEQLPILMGTLGKAIGTAGAFVAGSEALIETLIQFARTYIYTTAMPPAVAAATSASLDLLQSEGWRRQHLKQLIQRFRDGAEQLGLALMPSQSAIQPLQVGDAGRALELSDRLAEHGLWISAIRPPTVPAGSARLRITLSAAHSEAQIDYLLSALEAVAV